MPLPGVNLPNFTTMSEELTFTDKKKRKIAELQRLIALLSDDNKQLDLEKREKQLLTDLEQVRLEISDYRAAVGLPARSPAGTLMAAPIAAKISPQKGNAGPRGPNGPRVNPDEMRDKLIAALREIGPQGLTVTELANKSGYKFQTCNNFRKSDPKFLSMTESIKKGVAVYLKLKPVQP